MIFELGRLVATKGIADKMEEDEGFRIRVNESMQKYTSGDWGNLPESDASMNDHAVIKNNDRIFAKYDIEPTIWIITEWNREYTTILFPSEY